jgi:hypothetical protein
MNQSITARYWKIVRACLVEFYGYSNHAAAVRVREFRASLASLERVSDDPFAGELVYHEEPLNIARDLSKSPNPGAESEWPRYIALRERIDRPEPESRKAVLNVEPHDPSHPLVVSMTLVACK